MSFWVGSPDLFSYDPFSKTAIGGHFEKFIGVLEYALLHSNLV